MHKSASGGALPAAALRWAQLASLVVSVVFIATAIVLLLGSASARDPGNAAVAASGFAAAAAVLFAVWQHGHLDASARSKFALETAMRGVERAFAIIDVPGAAERMNWVNAARILARGARTATNITMPDHRDAWSQFHEEWRIKFFRMLNRSLEFYLGLQEPDNFDPRAVSYSDEKIVALLKQTNVETLFNMEHLYSSGTSNSLLAEQSLKVIYDFAQFGAAWVDPLDEIEDFTDADVDRIARHDLPGLHVFLYAQRKWFVIGDSVTPRATDDAKR